MSRACWLLLWIIVASHHGIVSADEPPARNPAAKPTATGDATDKLVPLNKEGTVLIDNAGKRLLVKAEVVLREGLLEMFACLKQTKEHESIVAVDAKAQVIHAGLLALGAEPGSPVHWTPEFKPPTGTRIEIHVQWTDDNGKLHRVPAQTWVRHATRRYFAAKLERLPADLALPKNSELRYDQKNQELLWYGPMSEKQRDQLFVFSKDEAYRQAVRSLFKQGQFRQMDIPWVFAGSSVYTDPMTGRKYYQAEAGDLICVANFSTALLDVAAASQAENDSLMFEAYTERIPPLGTKVTLELVPALKKATREKRD